MARRLTDIVAMQVRLPEGLRRQLASAAEANARSLNSEILWRLGQSFGPQEQRLVAGTEREEKAVAELRERVINSPEMAEIVNKLIERDRSSKGLKER
jgi:hypothetical protein